MDLIFTNGTTQQKALWRSGLDLLLHLPLDAVPLTIEVSFVPPEDVGQTNFAETSWVYGSTTATTLVRNDAPGFGGVDAALIAEATRMGLTYSATQHFHETAAHELGHAFFAALPEAARLAVLALFGIDTDDIEVLSPEDKPWQDRPIEAVAEVFKEAFLPARHRVFPNRTNIKLSYGKYPEFRRLFREALPQIVVSGTLGPGETAVPAYDFDYLAQGEPLPPQGYSPPIYLAATDGKHGLHSTAFVDFGDDAFGRGRTLALSGESVASAWVKHGAVLSFTLALDDNAFPDSQNEFRFNLLYHSFVAGPVFPPLFEGRWLSQLEDPEFPRYSGEDDALTVGDPPFVYTKLIAVDGRFTHTRVCNGTVYRFVELVGFARQTFLGSYTQVGSHEPLRAARYYPYLPELRVVQSVCPAPAAEGQPIVIPDSVASPVGSSSGAKPHLRPVSGQ